MHALNYARKYERNKEHGTELLVTVVLTILWGTTLGGNVSNIDHHDAKN